MLYAAGVRLDRIYTRAGDAGQTSLGDGERVSKNDARIWAYGTVDETGPAIGAAVAGGLPDDIAELLRRVQNDLFDVGADLWSLSGRRAARARAACASARLTSRRSRMRATGTPRRSSRSRASSSRGDAGRGRAPRGAHDLPPGRAVRGGAVRARRGEPAALAYLNRLSDLLFILARVANDGGRGDVLWQPGASIAPDSA